ncbi:MAG: hypothetical protein V3U92_07415 [Cellulophaga sp.]
MPKTTEKLFFLYKTSIENEHTARLLKKDLDSIVGNGSWNFDFEDADKVLRIICFYDARIYIETLLIKKVSSICVELHYHPNEFPLKEENQAIMR